VTISVAIFVLAAFFEIAGLLRVLGGSSAWRHDSRRVTPCTPQQLGVVGDDHRACRHQDRGKRTLITD